MIQPDAIWRFKSIDVMKLYGSQVAIQRNVGYGVATT